MFVIVIKNIYLIIIFVINYLLHYIILLVFFYVDTDSVSLYPSTSIPDLIASILPSLSGSIVSPSSSVILGKTKCEAHTIH